MSRLIVKGLPKRIEEKELRSLFSSAGQVTDAKIIRDRDGKSRQFAFVGFRNEADAAAALKKINGTYVRTSRVQVEFARAAGDPSIPRPWSKHSKGSSAYEKRMENEEREKVERFRAETRAKAKQVGAERKKAAKKAKVNETTISEKDREQFNAFKDAARKRKSVPLWADGQSVKGAASEVGEKLKDSTFAELENGEDDSEGEYSELPSKKADASSPREELKTDALAHDDGISDADYFKSKISDANLDVEDSDEEDEDSENENEDDDNESDDDDESESEKEEEKEEEKDISSKAEKAEVNKENVSNKADGVKAVDAAETGRLFVRNLAFNVSEEELEGLFEKYGALSEVHIVVDSATKRSRGVAFVSFAVPEQAAKAMSALDGTVFSGRLMHVLPGRPKPGASRDSSHAQVAGMNKFKMERESNRLQAARDGRDESAQNAMHLGSDAVADSMAKRLGISKAELLGTSHGASGAAAVRLSIAEATMQGETRQFLLDNGVDMKKVEQAASSMNANTASAKRSRSSRTAFLVKNLPSGSSERELENMFSKFGTLVRLAMAPNSLLAIVEYSTPGEAKKGYNRCVYKRFRDVPLYLEWIPTEALISSRAEKVEKAVEESEKAGSEEQKGKQEDDHLVNASSVYIKNLNFDTTEQSLRTHMESVLRRRPDVVKAIRSIAIATKKNPKDEGGAKLSAGFGFVEFSSYSFAAEAVKVAQGSSLDGHQLELRVSNRQVDNGVKKRKRTTEKRKPSAKLLVRNVAFEATPGEVRQLFSSFGQLKSVRLPRKMDGSHRGFGFLEFVSTNEAKSAKEALSDAHLYGRHLVIEYAEEASINETSIEKLMENAAESAKKSKRARIENSGDDGDEEGLAKVRDALYN